MREAREMLDTLRLLVMTGKELDCWGILAGDKGRPKGTVEGSWRRSRVRRSRRLRAVGLFVGPPMKANTECIESFESGGSWFAGLV